MNQRRDVTGLVGIGILLLLASGLGFSPISDGFLGIDVLFVAAGFLATKEILREFRANAKHNRGYGWVTLGPFYLKRLRYLIPSALIAVVLVWLAVSFTNDSRYLSGVTSDAIWSALMLANVHFIHQGVDFMANTSHSSPLLNFWAISTYVQVVLVYPLLLVAALGFKNYRIQNKRVGHRKRAIYALAAIAIITTLITVAENVFEPKTAMFTSTARLADFAIGGLFAAIRINEVTFGRAQLLLSRLVALIVIVFSPFLAKTLTQNSSLLVIAIAAGFVAASHSTRIPDSFSIVLGMQPLYGLGVISGQVLIWYWPILVLAHRYGFHVGYQGSVGNRLLLGVVIICLAIFSHLAASRLFVKASIASSDDADTSLQDALEDEVDTEVEAEIAKDEAISKTEQARARTAYQNRTRVLVAAVLGTVCLALVSAPSIIAPPEKNGTSSNTANPSPGTSTGILSPHVVFLGASITSGCCTKHVPGWAIQTSNQLSWTITNLAKRGTGYSHGNSYGPCSDGSCRSILAMAVRAVTMHPDAVVVSGGRNDCQLAISDPSRVQSAVNQTFDSLRSGLPHTPIIAMSVIYNEKRTIPECYSRLNSWISAAAARNHVAFVPGVTTWLAGHRDYLNKDDVHPNDAGHTEIARRFVQWFQAHNIRVEASIR